MKAVVEYWVPQLKQYEREDELIARNAFEFNGMGIPSHSVVVTGERITAGEAGDALYEYKFLWIIEDLMTQTLGVVGSYPCGLRPAMGGLSQLRKPHIEIYSLSQESARLVPCRKFMAAISRVSVKDRMGIWG